MVFTSNRVRVGVVSGVIRAMEEEEEEESRCFQIVGVGSRSGRIHQSQCRFPCFVIGLDLVLPLLTPTIWFSLDHKLNVSAGLVSGIGTQFSLDHKLFASD